MMKIKLLLFLTGTILLSCQNSGPSSEAPKTAVTRIAFGSCAHQDKDQPLLKVAAALNPDVFLFLGDNISLPAAFWNKVASGSASSECPSKPSACQAARDTADPSPSALILSFSML